MILDTVAKRIEVILGGAVTANELHCYSAYADHTTTTFTPKSNDTLTSGASAVTLVAAPAVSIQRQVKYISVFNADTVAATITIRLVSSATRTLMKVTLATGEHLVYDPANGWQVIKVDGSIKSVGPAGSDKQVQFNDAGNFGAISGFVFDKTEKFLTIKYLSGGSNIPGYIVERYAADAGNNFFIGRHSRNATEGGHTAVLSGDGLATFLGQGSTGSVFANGAYARIHAEENWSGTANGASWRFFTTKNTTAVLNEVLRLDQDARVRVFFSFSLEGDLTPSSLAANQNDYNPTGLADAVCIRQASSVAVNITGLQGGADGRIMIITNVNGGGGSVITLTNEDAASAAANRFAFTANVALNPFESITLRYDSTSSRWRPIGGKGA